MSLLDTLLSGQLLFAALVTGSLDEAIALTEQLAPEHLQLVGADVEAAAHRFTRAGAVFVGAEVPEALGDYVAGPSHVLPTCGSARFASGLSVETFRRRWHRIEAAGDTGERIGRSAGRIVGNSYIAAKQAIKKRSG